MPWDRVLLTCDQSSELQRSSEYSRRLANHDDPRHIVDSGVGSVDPVFVNLAIACLLSGLLKLQPYPALSLL